MELLAEALPIILYFLGIVLLVILIVLAIKLISTVDKTNRILDNVEEKAYVDGKPMDYDIDMNIYQ